MLDEILVGGDGGFLLGLHQGEEEHVLNVLFVCHHHHQAVDANAHAASGWHAVLEGAHEVHVDKHGLVVAFLAQTQLLLEALFLVDGVVELAIGVSQFLAADEELEAFGEVGIVAVALAEGRHVDGVVCDEGGLYQRGLALLAEDGVDQLAFAHRLVDFNVEGFAGVAQLLLVHVLHVVASLFLDEFAHRSAAEGTAEVNLMTPHVHFGSAV